MSWPTRTGHVPRAMRGSMVPIHLLAIKNVKVNMKCIPVTYQELGVSLAHPAAISEKERPTVFPVGWIVVGGRSAKVPTFRYLATVIDVRHQTGWVRPVCECSLDNTSKGSA